MRLNKNVKIVSNNVILVPYEECHVTKYHQWMQSEELQHLTASEPLTIEEEYAMQKSWREDDDKCTFIILDRNIFESTQNEIESMIGDTNLFLGGESPHMAEVEIMIAEKQSRGKRLGWESVILMMLYGIEHLDIKSYQVKISFSNINSIKMFEKLDFIETEKSDVFKEITMEKHIDPDWILWMKSQYIYEMLDYI